MRKIIFLIYTVYVILLLVIKPVKGYTQTNVQSTNRNVQRNARTNITKKEISRSKNDENESIINLTGSYIGRVNNNFNPTVSEGSRTWRLDEIPGNIVYLNFNFIFLEHISGLITISGKTTKESRTERYASKWKNLTLSLYQSHIKLVTKIGSLMVYHNQDVVSFNKPIKVLTGLKLFQEYRHIYKEQNEQIYERVKSYDNNVVLKLYDEFKDVYNPYDNIIVRSFDINEKFGKGTQGIVCQTKYSIFKNIFIIADDNTTREDAGSLQSYQISGTGYLIYLDKNNDSILDINENDIMHHNFWADRFEIELSDIKCGITYIGEQLYKWEKSANLLDPWDSKYENIDSDTLLRENDLLLPTSDSNVFIRAAERYARQDIFSFDITYNKFKATKISAEFGLNKIKQRYVSKPKKSHITKYDPSYPYYTINRSIDVEIPWNNGEHIGSAFGVRVAHNLLFANIIAEYRLENRVFNMDIFDNPNEDDTQIIGDKSFFRPVSRQSIYAELNLNYYGFEPVFKFVDIIFNRIYPDGDKINGIYKNTIKKRESIMLIYSEVKRRLLKRFLPAFKLQFINYGKVSKIHSQLFTPFVLRDNSEDFVEVDSTKNSTTILWGIEVSYFFYKSSKIKLAFYNEHISNKIDDIEDFKKFYLEVIANF